MDQSMLSLPTARLDLAQVLHSRLKDAKLAQITAVKARVNGKWKEFVFFLLVGWLSLLFQSVFPKIEHVCFF